MANKEFNIKITGSGTPEQLIKALSQVVENIKEAQKSEHTTALLGGAKWEDSTLFTEIKSE